MGGTDSRAGVGNTTELGEALPHGPGLEQGLGGTHLVSLPKEKLSQAPTFCHLVLRSMWCRGAATLSAPGLMG